MTKMLKASNLMLLKPCVEVSSKSKVAEGTKVKTTMRKVRQYLEGQALEASAPGHAK